MNDPALEKKVAGYKRQFDDTAHDDEYIYKNRVEALGKYLLAAKYCYKKAHDIEDGKLITAEAKHLIDVLLAERHTTFWEFEKQKQAEKVNDEVLDLGFEFYHLEAPYIFESYCLYLERHRAYNKRFYVPRRCTLQQVTRDLQLLEEDKIDFYGLSLPSRVGKLISDDTPILTDNGWKNHGDLKVGDRVVGRNGEYVKVIHVFPKNVANVRVHFSDHTFIDCHENHEWLVIDNGEEKIIVTKEILKGGNYLIPNSTEALKKHKGIENIDVIIGAEYITPKSGNCISVEDGLYRVGQRLKLTHNSTMGIEFLTWVGLRKPNSHSAMGGHSGQLAKRFFKGYSNFVETKEYTYQELFKEMHPDMEVVESKSSDPAEFIINLGGRDEFATISCRGIDGTWTGAIDISGGEDFGYLYVDDLVRDREHSLSASRMENTYQEYQNKMLDRMNDGAKEIMIGTLWNVNDPLERERVKYENDPRHIFKRIPALNENDESNFQYEIKGFSSQYYIKMRDRLDKAEWMAKYQQQPFVREGLVFPVEEIRTFNGILPDGQRTIVATCDPAFGGGDSLSMPICATFKGQEEKYIIDWIHDKRTPGHTVPHIVDKIQQHYITRLRIEKNSGGTLMADNIKKEMDARGIRHCKIELIAAPNRISKEDKISGYSDYVKRYFRFMISGQVEKGFYFPGEQYRKAFDELVLYSPEAKKIHDDAPDAIVQLAIMFETTKANKVEAVINPFRRR